MKENTLFHTHFFLYICRFDFSIVRLCDRCSKIKLGHVKKITVKLLNNSFFLNKVKVGYLCHVIKVGFY